VFPWAQRPIRWLARRFSVGTTTFVLHGLAGGIIVFLIEVLAVGISFDSWLYIRIAYNIVYFDNSALCIRFTDYLRLKFQGNSIHPFRRVVADTLSLAAYKIPLFASIALLFNLDGEKILWACFFDVGEIILTGWLYGIILDWVRRVHNESAPSQP